MDEDEVAVIEAALLTAARIPFDYVFVSKDGRLVGVKVVVRK